MKKTERNSFSESHHLYKEFKGRWSDWKMVMSRQPYLQFEKRSHIGYRVSAKLIKQLFGERRVCGPGIYEIMTNDWMNQSEVVYLGKAENLLERIKSYVYDGSHKKRNINDALYGLSSIYMRVLATKVHEKSEVKLLRKFSYQWNTKYPKKKPSGRKFSRSVKNTSDDANNSLSMLSSFGGFKGRGCDSWNGNPFAFGASSQPSFRMNYYDDNLWNSNPFAFGNNSQRSWWDRDFYGDPWNRNKFSSTIRSCF